MYIFSTSTRKNAHTYKKCIANKYDAYTFSIIPFAFCVARLHHVQHSQLVSNVHGWKSAVYIIFYVNCIYSELLVHCGFANNFSFHFCAGVGKKWMIRCFQARGFNTNFYGKLLFFCIYPAIGILKRFYFTAGCKLYKRILWKSLFFRRSNTFYGIFLVSTKHLTGFARV